MKSSTCQIDRNGFGREQVFCTVEKVAAYCDLEKKQALQLRLLAEELVGVLLGIAGNINATFWLEETDGLFQLYLVSDASLSSKMRDDLLEVSTSGKNEAAKGIMGKIRTIYENYVLENEELKEDRNASLVHPSLLGLESPSYPVPNGWVIWSLQNYKGEVSKEKEMYQTEWDELEKSIVANLADDITVGIQNGKVEIVVSKRFK